MTRALAAMDYETALACRVEVDDLRREADLLKRRYDIYLRRAELLPVKYVETLPALPGRKRPRKVLG
jgi:hypothetical protein